MTALSWRTGLAFRGLVLVGAVLPAVARAQEPAESLETPAPIASASLVVDGVALERPAGVFDPARGLTLTGSRPASGDRPATTVTVELPFDLLEWPQPGEYPLADRTAMAPEHSGEAPRMVRRSGEAAGPAVPFPRTVRVRWGSGADATDLSGRIVVRAFGHDRVQGTVTASIEGGKRTIAFDLVPVLKPSVALPDPVGADGSDGVLTSELEDLVVFALGGTGTGLPGAAYLIDSMASLAAMEGLDSVLLLGDTLGPRGVTGRSDRAWQTRFNRLFDAKRFPVTFYPVLSQRERRGHQPAPIQYGFINPRWSMPQLTYIFDTTCKGQTIRFIGVDTQLMCGDIARPSTRVPLRVAVHGMEQSKADWLVVFGHDAMHGQGVTGKSKRAAKLRERLEHYMRKFGVDAYISGGERSLQLVEPDGSGPDRKGPVHVISGGGGGPELADAFGTAGESLAFGMTGGGFVRLRFDGKMMEIAFYDQGAQLRFARRLPARKR